MVRPAKKPRELAKEALLEPPKAREEEIPMAVVVEHQPKTKKWCAMM
jgi:hypothetical protein